MIGTIRKTFSKKALNIILGVTILSMSGITFIISHFVQRSPSNKSIATIDGYEVNRSEFSRRVAQEQQRESFLRQLTPNPEVFFKAYGLKESAEERAFDALIQQKVLVSFADTMGLVLSPEYISSKLADPQTASSLLGDFIPAQAVTQEGVNYKDLLKMLQKVGITGRCLEEIVEERLKGEFVHIIAQSGAYVPQDAVRDEFNRIYRPRQFSVIKLSLDPYLKVAQAQKPTEEELKKIFEEGNQRAHRYWKPEQRTGKVWTFNHPTEDFTTQAQAAIKERGPALEEFIKKHNGTMSTIGPTERKNELLVRRLYSLKEGDSVAFTSSQAESTKRGFIVEVTKVEPSIERSFEESKNDAEKDFRLTTAVQKLAQDLDELKSMDKVALDAWIKSHQARVWMTDFITSDVPTQWQPLEKEGLSSQEITQLFSMDTLGERKTILNPTNGYLVELLSWGQPDDKKWEEKKDEIFARLMDQEQARVASGFIASLEKNARIKSNQPLFNRP